MATNKHIIVVETKGAEKSKQQIKGINGSLMAMGKKVAIAGAAFYAAKGVITAVSDLARQASKVEQLTRGFDSLGKKIGFTDSSFGKLNRAVNSTMKQVDLMTEANNAMMLGIVQSDDEMAQLFDTAQRLGQALGVDTRQAINSIVTGMGRQSKLMLDNLGIMVSVEKANEEYADAVGKTVSALTDQERKVAFNNAVLKESARLVSNLGDEIEDNSMIFDQYDVAIDNASVALGTLFAPVVTAGAKAITFLANELSDAINWKQRFIREFEFGVQVVTDETRAFEEWSKAIRQASIETVISQMIDLGFATEGATIQQLKAGIVAGDVAAEIDDLDANTLTFVGTIGKTVEELERENEKFNILLELIKAYTIETSTTTMTQEEYNKKADEGLEIKRKEIEMYDIWLSQRHDEGELLHLKTSKQLEQNETMKEFIDRQKEALELQEQENLFIESFILMYPEKAKALGMVSKKYEVVSEASRKMVSDLQVAGGEFKAFSKIAKVAAISETIYSTYQGAQDAFTSFASPKSGIPVPLNVILGAAAATAAVAAGLARVQEIKKAQYGADFVTSGPQMMMVGEGSGPERVQVTPLEDPNLEGPQAQGMTLNIQGSVIGTEEFTESTLIPQIKEGLRLGERI